MAIKRFFKMTAIHHLRFLKTGIFDYYTIQRVNMRHCAKFHSDRSNRCCDITLFLFLFKMATFRDPGFVIYLFIMNIVQSTHTQAHIKKKIKKKL